MKRFWAGAEAREAGEGFAVLLDGQQVRLPGGRALGAPTRALADAIAAEWRAAPEAFTQADMPLTALTATMIQRVAPDPAASVAALAAFAAHDLLCYRAEEPPALAAAEAAAWQPWLDWAARALDAPLAVSRGIAPVAQPPASLAALRAAVARQDAARLAALGVAVPALGSLVLGLALLEGGLDPAAAHEIATLDERFQAARWGQDAEAAARNARLAADIALAARFVALCGA